MSRGKRFDEEEKQLNMKKVAAVVIALLVIIMFVVGIKELFKEKSNTNEKVFTLGYYTVYEDGKWGVIDTKGNTVIKPTYTDMVVIPDNSKPVFFVLENVDYDDGTYSTKVINEKNEKIFTSYDKVELLYNHDENNNLWYESAIKVKKDGKYGLINLEGKETLQCSKDSIEVLEGTKSVYITSNDGQKGIVNNLGKEIITNKHVTITSLTENYEIDRTPFIIYNPSITPQKRTELTSYMNIVPTVANLFNLDYDPRLYMGQDLFSEYFVNRLVFADGSWQTDKAFYDAVNGKIKYYGSEEYTNEEIIKNNQEVRDMIKMSNLAITSNYFDYLNKGLKKYTKTNEN